MNTRTKIHDGHCHVTETDYLSMVDSATQPHHRVLLHMMWMFGIRISEALAVRVRDVDLESRDIVIHRLKKKVPTRHVMPIPQRMFGELAMLTRGKREHERLMPITRQGADVLVKRLAVRSGITVRSMTQTGESRRSMHCHAFRHGRTYDLLKKGFRDAFIAKFLGHADLSTILTYAHPQREDFLDMAGA